MNRLTCPVCGDETDFVQFSGAKSSTVKTDPEDVGDGLLELRICDNCGHGVETVLTAEKQRVVE